MVKAEDLAETRYAYSVLAAMTDASRKDRHKDLLTR
jgi:hypothetical protein